jgi:Xanthomonas XOO_2897-like deaminase
MIAHPDRASAPTRRPASPLPLRPADGAHVSSSRNVLAEELRHGVLRPAAVLALQRTVGNRAVVQLLARVPVPRHPTHAGNGGEVIQRYRSSKVTDPNSEIPELAIERRRELQNWDGSNLATLRFTKAAGGEYTDTKFSDPGGHSEVNLLTEHKLGALLTEQNRGVAVLYTERSPCWNCSNLLGHTLWCTDEVYYSCVTEREHDHLMRAWQAQTLVGDLPPEFWEEPMESAAAQPSSSGMSSTGE